jgi:hypothetical protein
MQRDKISELGDMRLKIAITSQAISGPQNHPAWTPSTGDVDLVFPLPKRVYVSLHRL